MEPSVNEEVGPILSAIVSDVVGTDGDTSESSPVFDTADAIFTNAVLAGAGNYIAGNAGSSSSSSSSSSGITGLIESGINGLLGGGGGSSSSGSSGTGAITDAIGQFASIFTGRKRK